ncbi:MAG: hypothetical protein IVW52_05110 [Acidimicrobiales bacterium]|nr:hypothetical protein [Acidimicrobiales bacterium]
MRARPVIDPHRWLRRHTNRGHVVNISIAGAGKAKLRRVEYLTCNQSMRPGRGKKD